MMRFDHIYFGFLLFLRLFNLHRFLFIKQRNRISFFFWFFFFRLSPPKPKFSTNFVCILSGRPIQFTTQIHDNKNPKTLSTNDKCATPSQNMFDKILNLGQTPSIVPNDRKKKCSFHQKTIFWFSSAHSIRMIRLMCNVRWERRKRPTVLRGCSTHIQIRMGNRPAHFPITFLSLSLFAHALIISFADDLCFSLFVRGSVLFVIAVDSKVSVLAES